MVSCHFVGGGQLQQVPKHRKAAAIVGIDDLVSCLSFKSVGDLLVPEVTFSYQRYNHLWITVRTFKLIRITIRILCYRYLISLRTFPNSICN